MIEQCVDNISLSAWNRIRTWTCEFMDKTPQIAKEQLIIWQWTKPKKQSFKETKVSVLLFSADISRSEEISRRRPIKKTLQYDFSATFIKKKY